MGLFNFCLFSKMFLIEPIWIFELNRCITLNFRKNGEIKFSQISYIGLIFGFKLFKPIMVKYWKNYISPLWGIKPRTFQWDRQISARYTSQKTLCRTILLALKTSPVFHVNFVSYMNNRSWKNFGTCCRRQGHLTDYFKSRQYLLFNYCIQLEWVNFVQVYVWHFKNVLDHAIKNCSQIHLSLTCVNA